MSFTAFVGAVTGDQAHRHRGDAGERGDQTSVSLTDADLDRRDHDEGGKRTRGELTKTHAGGEPGERPERESLSFFGSPAVSPICQLGLWGR